jgi:integrase
MNARVLSELVADELVKLGLEAAGAVERGQRYTRWCPRQPGFGTRCYAGGRTVYVVQTKMQGRLRTVTLCDVRLITITKARAIARRVLLRAQVGENPASSRTERRAVPLFRRFLDEYWNAVSPGWKPSTLRGNRHYRRHLERAFPRAYLDQITSADVQRWFAKITEAAGPAAANRAFELLRALFVKAEEWGILPESASPCRGITRNKLRKHECRLSANELEHFGAALVNAEANHPMAVAAIRLIALTGCRKSEILNLTWNEVRGRRLLLTDAKTGPRTVWLGRAGEAILASLERHPALDEVFWCYDQPLSVSRLDHVYRSCRDAAGLNHVRMHDLRHSFASHAASMSETLPMIARLMGHCNTAMTARYAHLDDADVLEVCERIGALISRAMGERGEA